jgi:hypothetical protein
MVLFLSADLVGLFGQSGGCIGSEGGSSRCCARLRSLVQMGLEMGRRCHRAEDAVVANLKAGIDAALLWRRARVGDSDGRGKQQ